MNWWIDEEPYPGPPHYEPSLHEVIHEWAKAMGVSFEVGSRRFGKTLEGLRAISMHLDEVSQKTHEKQEARQDSLVPPVFKVPMPPPQHVGPRPKFAFNRRGRKTF